MYEETDSESGDISKNLDIISISEMTSQGSNSFHLQISDTSESSLITPIININRVAESNEKKGPIFVDHCYARPWNWRPGGTFLKPTKTLFMPKPVKNTRKRSFNPLAPLQNCNEKIDVVEVPTEPPPIYDVNKARSLMDECEKHVANLKINQGDDWEETVAPLKINWTPIQHKLFNGMVNILNTDRLSRLTFENSTNEPILRRTVIEKSVKRIRRLLATISWDPKLTQWLHQLLLDHLNGFYLTIYLDMLQTLKAKLPTFVDKMIYSVGISSRTGAVSNENLFMLLKRPWDPVASSLMQDKPKKLPGNPVIVVAPSSPSTVGEIPFKRYQKWINLLSNLSSVVPITVNIGNMSHRMTMMNCADQMLAATRTRVQEIKNDLPGRPIVLVGFNVGAALALQVAQVEHAACVVCVGFSLLTADGKRGEPDDSLLELQCPVLFVSGQCANRSSQEELEDLRERMRIETGLIVVGSADDYLRISKKKKQAEGITQDVVDRCIVDEIGEFIGSIMLSPVPPQIRHSPVNLPIEGQSAPKRIKIERKRNNSNDSSIDSEPPSPTPRIVRPVGRPPGSKSKNKLESRWATQLSQGTPPIINISPPVSPKPPPVITPTPSESSVSETTPTDTFLSPLTQKFEAPTNTAQSLAVTNTSTSPLKPSQAAKMQAMGVGRPLMGSGSVIKKDFKSNAPKGTSIKVLDNVTITPGTPARFFSSHGKALDVNKMSRISGNYGKDNTGTSFGNMMLMAEGKLKSSGTMIRGTGNTPVILPVSKNKQQVGPTRYTKYITSKQLPVKKPVNLNQTAPVSSFNATLSPPTNLTSQDIMDLPIIFADDNQMLTHNTIQPAPTEFVQQNISKPSLPPPPPPPAATTPGKLIFMNKSSASASSVSTSTPTSIIITNSSLKRPALSVPVRASTHPVKYTKIILSRAGTSSTITETKNGTSPLSIEGKLSGLPADISVKKVEVPSNKGTDNYLEPIDLEKELVATTVPKPNYALVGRKVVEKNSIKTESQREKNENP
ncbi:KAT8 regulatory NSL complex subunit 3 [Agrilus planipennis]|uniref:KAT8 regulatory NSL complex subunit 3 n=1 Tax=Agrilus planipennis TaxID=224129 RepID=A0A1W4WBG1_AGRPL|nr:KAT8 regulatory NSL complex subunit 3 [Agrilus planipennis]